MSSMTQDRPAPPADCRLCPRLAEFRDDNKAAFPDKFNAPVPAFGDPEPKLLIIGLAPGLRGANFTGRPFTGDYAGDLLYASLLKYGFASGTFKADPNDGLTLEGCRIVNAVRCVPPQNKPIGQEINTCRQFLTPELDYPSVKAILCLGKIAHDSVIRSLGERLADYPFGHARESAISSELTVIDSYHCSRYNTNTGRLTEEMFTAVIERCKELVHA